MATYLLAYFGGDQPQSEDEGKAVMDAWIGWFTTLGGAVVDPGNPIHASAGVSSDGSIGDSTSGLNGYSVISADSLDDAIALAQGCPHLAANGRVEVFETHDVM